MSALSKEIFVRGLHGMAMLKVYVYTAISNGNSKLAAPWIEASTLKMARALISRFHTWKQCLTINLCSCDSLLCISILTFVLGKFLLYKKVANLLSKRLEIHHILPFHV